MAAMTCFHNFTAPVWQIFAGNLLLLICSIFYLVWWVVCFGPNASGKTAGGSAGAVYLTGAFIPGNAFIAGMICYVLYYRLEGTAGYRDGMAPLIIDAFVMAVFWECRRSRKQFNEHDSVSRRRMNLQSQRKLSPVTANRLSVIDKPRPAPKCFLLTGLCEINRPPNALQFIVLRLCQAYLGEARNCI